MNKFKICHKFLFYQVNIVFYQVKSVILPSDIMILPSDIMILPSDIMVLPNDWKLFISVNVEIFLRCDFATNWVLVLLIIVNLGIWVALIVIGNMNLKETFDKDSGIYSWSQFSSVGYCSTQEVDVCGANFTCEEYLSTYESDIGQKSYS